MIAYTRTNVLLVVLYYYVLRNKHSYGHSANSMMSVVVLFAYLKYKVEYLDNSQGRELQKFCQKALSAYFN